MPLDSLPRCSLCPGRTNMFHPKPIMGDGPLPCRVLFLAEGPARTEDRTGRILTGKTGQEFDGQYLPMAYLDRDEVRCTNVAKCSSPGYDNPTREVCRSCADRFLEWELQQCQPEVIIPMGALACSVLGLSLINQHAMPVPVTYKSWSGVAFPLYHPAAGLRSSDFMVKLQFGFSRLHLYLTGKLAAATDSLAGREDYRLLDSGREVSAIWDPDAPTAIDTETLPYPTTTTAESVQVARYGSGRIPEMFCASWSQQPGTGYVILPGSNAFATFRSLINRHTNPTIFHNLPYDVPILNAKGVDINMNPRRAFDTMAEAYHRQYLPQGLKQLALLLCGMAMKDFQDVVTPYSLEKLLEWLTSTHLTLYNTLHAPATKRKKDPITKKLVPRTVMTKVKGYSPEWGRLLNKLGKLLDEWDKVTAALEDEDTAVVVSATEDTPIDSESVLDPWKRIDGWHGHDREILEFAAPYMPMPVRSVADAPLDEVVKYAGRDADATLRVFHQIRKLKTRKTA